MIGEEQDEIFICIFDDPFFKISDGLDEELGYNLKKFVHGGDWLTCWFDLHQQQTIQEVLDVVYHSIPTYEWGQ